MMLKSELIEQQHRRLHRMADLMIAAGELREHRARRVDGYLREKAEANERDGCCLSSEFIFVTS
jgi:hypothetical protein